MCASDFPKMTENLFPTTMTKNLFPTTMTVNLFPIFDPRYAKMLAAVRDGDCRELQFAIFSGANVNAIINRDNNTALHEAAGSGFENIVLLLLRAGAHTHVVNVNGNDAMHSAIFCGHAAVAYRIWQHTRDARFSAVHLAALGYGSMEAVAAITAKEVNVEDGCGYTPVMVAVAVGNIRMLTKLLSSDVNTETATKARWTSLMIACCNGHEACVRALLNAGANKEAANKDGATPLYIACQEGHEACVRALLDAGANKETAHKDGRTSLYIACQNGHEACVHAMVAAGANPAAVSKDGWTPLRIAHFKRHDACKRALLSVVDEAGRSALHVACQQNREACVRDLLGAGANREAVDKDGATPLHLACEKGHEACVRTLLGAGANREAVNKESATPLYVACANGELACVRVLLGVGVKMEAANKNGATPLHIACSNGHEACVRAMLDAGANKETAQKDGATPLYAACSNGHEACVRALLDAGANKDAAQKDGRTPLHVACQNGHEACVRVLLNAGANKEAANQNGWTPLYIACFNGYEACERVLLGAGANTEAADEDGRTPLYVACAKGHEACVRALLEAGANKEAVNNDGWTPLHVACVSGNVACVRALLGARANKEAAMVDGRTPLYIACENGHEACVRVLLGAGVFLSAFAKDGSTPLSIARSSGHVSILRLLEDAVFAQAPPLLLAPVVFVTEQTYEPIAAPADATHASCHYLRAAAQSSYSPASPPDVGAPIITPPPAASVAPTIACEISFKDIAFDLDGGEQVELGHGSFGTVYAGRWKGERVAIKKMTLPLEWITSGRFWREVQLHMQASYKHVVRVHGACVRPVPRKLDEMAGYVVMDLLVADLSSALFGRFNADDPAHSVAAAVRPLSQRLRLLLEIARGVRFLHAQNIVHADLKPGNVMLDRAGTAQLTDFGLAVQRHLDASRTRSSHKGVRGTLAYMDPVLAASSSGEGASVKPASDMYSWGVLAWEMLTLRRPYEGGSSGDGGAAAGAGAGAGVSAGAHVSGASPLGGVIIPSISYRTFGGERPHDVLARVADVPPGLRALIVRCWSEDQSARPTAEDAIAVLEPLV
ncbi:hypothetical protein EON66_00860 [archaeon]|nr:MAG: hypothetical protein EON66_00860 [archaeon]